MHRYRVQYQIEGSLVWNDGDLFSDMEKALDACKALYRAGMKARIKDTQTGMIH